MVLMLSCFKDENRGISECLNIWEIQTNMWGMFSYFKDGRRRISESYYICQIHTKRRLCSQLEFATSSHPTVVNDLFLHPIPIMADLHVHIWLLGNRSFYKSN